MSSGALDAAGSIERMNHAVHSDGTVGAPLRRSQDVLAALLIALIAIAPMRDGSRALEAQATNAIIAGFLLLFFEITVIWNRTPHPMSPRWILGPAALFGLGTLWVLLQLSTDLPQVLLHPAWQMTSDVLQQSVLGRVTVDPDLTAAGFLRLLTTATVFWLAAQLSRSARRGYALLAGLVVVELVFAVYGLLLLVLEPGALTGQGSERSVTSSFVIRNTYATYVGLGVLVCVAMTWRLLRRSLDEEAGTVRLAMAALIRQTGGAGAFWIGSFIVLSACLLLSVSRGGALSTAAGLFVLVTLAARSANNAQGRHRSMALGIVVGMGMVALAVFAFGDLLLGRLSASGLGDAGRPFVYRTTLQAIADSPWFGWGYGTFVSVFPLYFDGTGDAFVSWDLAHNTYLEVLLGAGVPAGIMLIGAVAWTAMDCLKGARTRSRDVILPALAGASSMLVGVHALVDFSLQYQGVALTYALILGVGFAQARSARSVGTGSRPLPRTTPSRRKTAV